MHISSEQVLIVGMFLVYPVLAILLVLGKAVKHRPFLRLSRHMRSNVSEKMLSDEVLRMVDLLETAYNGYDIHVSKMLYRWQLKSEELGLFKPCEARQEFARLFLKLFYARIFADRIGQTRIVSKILYRTYALATDIQVSATRDSLVEQKAVEEYVSDLERIEQLFATGKSMDRTNARLLLDKWIEFEVKPTLALPDAYVLHMFMLSYVCGEDVPGRLRGAPVCYYPSGGFTSYGHYLLFGLQAFAAALIQRVWSPVAFYCYRKQLWWCKEPVTTSGFRIVQAIIEAARSRSPLLAMRTYAFIIQAQTN